jgi:hypothetical protein
VIPKPFPELRVGYAQLAAAVTAKLNLDDGPFSTGDVIDLSNAARLTASGAFAKRWGASRRSFFQ